MVWLVGRDCPLGRLPRVGGASISLIVFDESLNDYLYFISYERSAGFGFACQGFACVTSGSRCETNLARAAAANLELFMAHGNMAHASVGCIAFI